MLSRVNRFDDCTPFGLVRFEYATGKASDTVRYSASDTGESVRLPGAAVGV